jgi:uracil phosphoribosyltransferase
MSKLNIIDHPLVQHKLSLMRDKTTGVKEFRELMSETAMLLCYEATRDLPLKTIETETPQGIAKANIISGRKLAVVPILRAGLGMIDGVTKLIPAAKIGHIGMFRDPGTMMPVKYYTKFPDDIAEREVIVVDAMLATGTSAVEAITEIKSFGVTRIKYICILASPEGAEHLQANHPDVEIYCAGKDKGLNENGYIVPGLGDAGDRLFGTK